jgi:hypothetical protein
VGLLLTIGIAIVVITAINISLYVGVRLGQKAAPLPIINPENKLVLQYSFILSFRAGITGGAMVYFFNK